MFVVILIFVLFQLVESSGISNETGCLSEPQCLKCGPKGCIKCPNLIVHPSRRCVTTCPYGHQPRWSTRLDYMGRICVHNGNFLGLPSETATVLTGVIAGTVLCAILIGSAVIYLRIRRKNMPQNIDTSSDLDDSPERRDFLKQLETLKPYAQTYLDMLNDTRRQVRELHRTGDTHALAAYKPVLRDLAKILLILNRKSDRVAVPDDWEHLFNWAEKTLKRYKRMSDVSQPQVAQLINFLQGPVLPIQDAEIRNSTTLSTFKPDQVFGSSLSLQSAAIKNFNSNYDSALHATLNPQWKFEYSLVNSPTSEFNPAVWKNSKEYLNSSLFLDDDFCQLGFRPQDEITTEL
ncbi:uncharacterized protein LOC123003670 [Tribolium madens]|uniref:uncharacterized protein LOC123003670 n=1 Tax=Tribolium madens TaxID=41895 RepID=UPI001CF75291|nr:uncharacterized protein LOC123003670 [Tribolium madens]